MPSGSGTKRDTPAQLELRILATTDLHMQVVPFDFCRDTPVEYGLSRLAPVIDALRNATPNTLLVDNGDLLQGTPMGDLLASNHDDKNTISHIAVSALNHLGYDAATLGNHDYNFGLDFLTSTLSKMHFPIVVTNADHETKADGLDKIQSHILLERRVVDTAGLAHTLKIAVLGTSPKEVMAWDRHFLQGKFQVHDPVAAIKKAAATVRAAGADVVLVLCHSGIGDPQIAPEKENIAHLVAQIPGVDALVSGHSHMVFPSPDFAVVNAADVDQGTLHGTPTVLPGWGASHVGVIDLTLEQHDGRWQVNRGRAFVQPSPPDSAQDTAIVDMVAPLHTATQAALRKTIGQSHVPLHSFFAAMPFDVSSTVVASAQAWFIKQQLADGPYADLPILSAASPHRTGDRAGPGAYLDMPPGDISMQDISALYVFPNTFQAILMTGADVRGWLENASLIFNRLTPGGGSQPLLNPLIPKYQFEFIQGLSYSVDLSKPAGDADNPRVDDVLFKGAPLRDDMQFVLATSNYRTGGSGGYVDVANHTTIYTTPRKNRDIVIDFLSQATPLENVKPQEWRFRPLGGVKAHFLSGPGAAHHIDMLAPVKGRVVGADDDGFMRIEITL